MLVLTRKINEKIVVSGDIIIEVLEIRDSRVRLGIKAPEDVSVRRYETLEREDDVQPPSIDPT